MTLRPSDFQTLRPSDLRHMKNLIPLFTLILLMAGCSTQKELSYLINLDEVSGQNEFPMDVPDYKVQPRDILYVSVKAQTPEGALTEMLNDRNSANMNYVSNEGGAYMMGYSIDPEGNVTIPMVGDIRSPA